MKKIIFNGDFYTNTNYGGYIKNTYFSELISISASNTYNISPNLYISLTQVPSGSSIQGVGARVVTEFQTSSAISIGLSSSAGGFISYWGSELSSSAGYTNITDGLTAGVVYIASASSVCVSSSVLQGNTPTTGTMRLECFYSTLNPPTS
jgi:hypothetical protein